MGIAAGALVCLGCGSGEPPPSMIRLGDFVPRAAEQRQVVVRGLRIEGPKEKGSQVTAIDVPADLEAPRVAALEIRAAGDAAFVRVNWRLEGHEEFAQRRSRVVVALRGDGGEHVSTVDLEGHPAWRGRVVELRFAVEQGTLQIREVAAVVPESPYREVQLGRLLVPALASPGRLEIPLPPAPGRAVFETHLGLLPGLLGSGSAASFHAWIESDGVRTPWLETTIPWSPDAGWQLVRREVKLGRRSVLVLETEVRRGARVLSPQLAFWGDPKLFFDTPEEGRNLLVVAVDTLRADVLGAYGDQEGLTPQIDGLARRSIRFTDLTAPSPWTLPSFASLLTGFQPQTHGAGRTLGAGRNAPISRLGPGLVTLPRFLSEAGFLTVGFYANPYLGPSFGLHRHFDEYHDAFRQRAGPVVEQAVETLERVGGRRFFLFVHLMDPHTPYEPDEQDCRQVARRLEPSVPESEPCRADRSDQEDVPPERRPWIAALYRAEVANVDRQIGRLLAALDEQGLRERTVVLLVSDHGEELWEHREQEERYGYAFGDHGHSHYQELLHVPAILFVPGEAPREVAAPAEMVDLFPTVLRYLGLKPPPSQGRDLSSPTGGEEERLRLSAFLHHGSERWAARRGPWKLVVKPGEDPVVELYNLRQDPAETRDRSGEERGVLAALRREAEAEILARGELGRRLTALEDQPAELDERLIEELRALGYLR